MKKKYKSDLINFPSLYLKRKVNIYLFIMLCISMQIGLHAQSITNDSLEIIGLIEDLKNKLYSKENHEVAVDILERSKRIDLGEGILFAKKRIGNYHERSGEYDKAIATFEEVYELAESLGNKFFVGDSYLGLGNIYLLIDELELSLSYYQKTLKISQEIDNIELKAHALNGMSVFYMEQELYEEALVPLQNARKLFTEMDEEGTRITNNRITTISNLGIICANLNKEEDAFIYFQEALELTKEVDDSLNFTFVYGDLAYGYQNMGNFDKALSYYDSSLYYSNYFKQEEVIYSTYADISDTYKLKGDNASALLYYKRYHELEKQILSDKIRNQIAELEFKFETERKEKELLQAQKRLSELMINRQRMWIVIGGLLASLLLGLLFFRKVKEDAKRNHELQQTNAALIKSKLKNKALEAQQLQQNLDNKQSDLTNLALDIARKNEFSNQLLTQLEVLQKTSPPATASKLREMTMLASNHLRISKDLSQFQSNIDAINQEFYQKLEMQFENLSSNEKYLCGLIRLNLSNKDIAAIRGISSNSAKVNRYRLRKKLALEPNIDIVSFLQKI